MALPFFVLKNAGYFEIHIRKIPHPSSSWSHECLSTLSRDLFQGRWGRAEDGEENGTNRKNNREGHQNESVTFRSIENPTGINGGKKSGGSVPNSHDPPESGVTPSPEKVSDQGPVQRGCSHSNGEGEWEKV
jgi:hypothetical protein